MKDSSISPNLFISMFLSQDHKPQRSISQPNDETTKPNVFKRAWLRMSQRKTKKKRPRSTSEPGARRRMTPDERSALASRALPDEPGKEKQETPQKSQVEESEGNASLRRMTTPEGYEMMDDDVPESSISRKSRTSRTSETSSADGTVISRPSVSDKSPITEEPDEPDGYVMVDGMDIEEIVKEAERRVQEETRREAENEINAQKEKADNKSSTLSDSTLPGANAQELKDQASPSAKATHDEIEKSESTEKEDNRGSVGYDNIDLPVTVPAAVVEPPFTDKSPKTPVRPKSLETKQEMKVNVNKSRRGMRKPPPDIVLSPNDMSSPENPYVNSPPLVKSVDYVNIPGSNSRGFSNGIRNRSKTANSGKSSKKLLNPYEKYDGNDDSIYHSVESLLPGNPAYQNIRAESNRSHSFDNIHGHAYTNLPGHAMNGQTYQNIGPPGQTYVNVTPSRRKRFQKNENAHQLNYIQVEGTDGIPGLSGQPSFSTPAVEQQKSATSPSSEYTWIDESRTRLLKETARMHSDLRKENLPKVSKKY